MSNGYESDLVIRSGVRGAQSIDTGSFCNAYKLDTTGYLLYTTQKRQNIPFSFYHPLMA